MNTQEMVKEILAKTSSAKPVFIYFPRFHGRTYVLKVLKKYNEILAEVGGVSDEGK